MSAVDSPVLEPDPPVLNANQVAARNHSPAQLATRFQPGVSGNPNGRPKGVIGAQKLFEMKMLAAEEGEQSRLDEAMENLTKQIAAGDSVAMWKWLDREWPAVSKNQTEITAAVHRPAPTLPTDTESRKAVAEILDAEVDVIDVEVVE